MAKPWEGEGKVIPRNQALTLPPAAGPSLSLRSRERGSKEVLIS